MGVGVPATDKTALIRLEIDQSIAASVGHAVEPAIKPLGFNWKIGIGLITSLAAREVIVGTLGTIYGIDGPQQELVVQAALESDYARRAARP